jgi:hypothetical protein
MEMQMTTVAIFSWGSGLEAEYSMYYPIKTFSTATVCLFHAYLLTFPCFFGDAIEDIYNKYTSLSIYQKKEFIYFCCNALLPYTDPLRPLESTTTEWCSLVG